MSSGMTLVRTKADALDDAAPNATLPPETEVWHPPRSVGADGDPFPVRGCRFVLEFDVALGNSCDVTVWTRDDTKYRSDQSDLTAWHDAGTLVGVTDGAVAFDDETGQADLYFQVTNLTGGNPVAVYSEPRE